MWNLLPVISEEFEKLGEPVKNSSDDLKDDVEMAQNSQNSDEISNQSESDPESREKFE